jgi:hypothetical protein
MWHQILAQDASSTSTLEIQAQPAIVTQEAVNSFVKGQGAIVAKVMGTGLEHTITSEQIRQALIKSAERNDAWGEEALGTPILRNGPTDYTEWAEYNLRLWADPTGSWDNPHRESAAESVWAAAEDVLRDQGFLRGPCPRCGRPGWYVANPKPKGRPPLTLTFCPSCAESEKRAREAGKKRRQRSKGE